MTGVVYAAAAGEFFGCLKEIASLVPAFDERKKNMIAKETDILISLESAFHKAALEFNETSRSDELLGLAHEVRKQEKKLKDLYIIFSKEISAPIEKDKK